MNELNKEDIVGRLRQAGVVGAGGAGFPTYVKAASRAEWVIANAAECEPLLRGNQELLCWGTNEVIKGLRSMMRATGARRATIGIKAKYKAAVAALHRALADAPEQPAVEMHLLGDFYPAGDEHILVQEVTGRTIPTGGIPMEVGVVVNNVETLYNVARAMDGVPVSEKLVTVTGAVRRPVTLRAPVGTPLLDLVLPAGPVTTGYALIDGGPMMGRLAGPEAVVTKTTGGVIVLPVNHPLILGRRTNIEVDLRRIRGMCCHCSYCTELCPRYLLGHGLRPDKMMAGVIYTNAGLFQRGAAWLCSECGLCEVFACPMGLSPRRVNAWLKREMTRQGLKPAGGELRGLHPGRPYRMVPTGRLVARLGLGRYDLQAPLQEKSVQPRQVRMLLKQHVGAPAVVMVQPGERVAAGQVVAGVPGDNLGVPVHAGISGQVTQVTPEMVVIEAEGR